MRSALASGDRVGDAAYLSSLWPSVTSASQKRVSHFGILASVTPAQDVSIMSASSDIRSDAIRLVEQLPADASWDDVAYEVYVRQAIEQGLVHADAGRTVEHETAIAQARARIRRAS